MTTPIGRLKILTMNRGAFIAVLVLSIGFDLALAAGQRGRDDFPTAALSFVVLKDANGKPVRNAAVVMHEVDNHGKQERGDLELKTDADGKCSYEGVPYGKLRVQILAQGFQTYGEDYDIEQPTMEITVHLKRPSQQYSIYDEHSKEKSQDQNAKPPQ
jgi:5-hydroxyisourate hydrolase-like protein (transthyretin family)